MRRPVDPHADVGRALRAGDRAVLVGHVLVRRHLDGRQQLGGDLPPGDDVGDRVESAGQHLLAAGRAAGATPGRSGHVGTWNPPLGSCGPCGPAAAASGGLAKNAFCILRCDQIHINGLVRGLPAAEASPGKRDGTTMSESANRREPLTAESPAPARGDRRRRRRRRRLRRACTCCTGCARWACAPSCSRPATTSAAPGTGTATRAPACDVECINYSFSFSAELEQDWPWSERYAPQPEILEYARHVADRFDLRRDIRFDTRVTAARYDEPTQDLAGRDRPRRRRHGPLLRDGHRLPVGRQAAGDPGNRRPSAGSRTTPARWPHEGVDFSGLRVGLIGTGSSGVQSIPVIAEQAADLTVFQRTPAYSLPARNRPLHPGELEGVQARYGEWRQAQRESGIRRRRARPRPSPPSRSPRRSGTRPWRRRGTAAA